MNNTLKMMLALLLASSLNFISCARRNDTTPIASDTLKVSKLKQGDGKALVKSVNMNDKTIMLDHNTIPGVMDAMAMAYPVERPELLQAAKAGDSVAFTLKERAPGDFVISSISPLSKH